jgi:hypothetical protein
MTLMHEGWFERIQFNDKWSKKPTLLPEDWPERIHIAERWNKVPTLPPVDWPDKIQVYGHERQEEESLRIWHAYTTHKLESTNSTSPVVHGINHADMVVGICIYQVQLPAH